MFLLPPLSTLFPYTSLSRSFQEETGLDAEAIDTCMKLGAGHPMGPDRKSTRLNSSHRCISYAVFCLKKKNMTTIIQMRAPGMTMFRLRMAIWTMLIKAILQA